jgi:hypothetical protein
MVRQRSSVAPNPSETDRVNNAALTVVGLVAGLEAFMRAYNTVIQMRNETS